MVGLLGGQYELFNTKSMDKLGSDIEAIHRAHHVQPTIFVSLASYRDVLCSDTLNYIFLNARHPQNIYIGLVDQGSELLEEQLKKDGDPLVNGTTSAVDPDYPVSHCYRGLKISKELALNNIRRTTMTVPESRGPTLARQRASMLYRNETYYMQIDSHVRFIVDWDLYVMNDLWSLKGRASKGRHGVPKAILSAYPMPYEETDPGLPKDDQKEVSRLCKAVFNKNGMITFNGYILKATATPAEIPFVAAGFFFGNAEFLEKVPFDPHLPNLFEGEEILLTVRLFTIGGYRFFAPTKNLCYHYYMRSKHPKFWNDNTSYQIEMAQSQDRVKYILGMDPGADLSQPKYVDLEPYDIKNKSLINDYWERYNIDVGKSTMDVDKWC
ncbi:hypothetical protein SAMD00019534_055020 [Acytostelium subglobosum LB1]|uniref:hypothetical protein n=1 Tax=Acytostelium subglobosum LB1 TaxID=1410327 RepID=UPI000644D730|nr:hypothetical protein SAMD00019534_055020 [Acytostelium subglobosum LB1]GAM22327.1 hypothetical protein SAMD00019534_055020 [Acytostelium subglobosum LB1]|eukprot:XP_012754447.1 hypothetical protein SAMD00019534_055020 [Acytostelium subglobosum LB1]